MPAVSTPLLRRAADMNIHVSVQPGFFSELGDGFLEAFDMDLVPQIYPFKSMLAAGLVLGGSSDCPVTTPDPRIGIRDAVLRRTGSGSPLGPQEALTTDQALRLCTTGA